MRVRKLVTVIDAKDSLMWYAQDIGKTFLAWYFGGDVYWAREPAGYKNIIYASDAVEVGTWREK